MKTKKATRRKKIETATGKTIIIKDCPDEDYLPILIPGERGLPDVACLKRNDPIVKKIDRMLLRIFNESLNEAEYKIDPKALENFLDWFFYIEGFKVEFEESLREGVARSKEGKIYYEVSPNVLVIKDPENLLEYDDLERLLVNLVYLSDANIRVRKSGNKYIIEFE